VLRVDGKKEYEMAGLVRRKSGIYSARVSIGNTRRTISLGTRSIARARRGVEFIQDLATSRATDELPETSTKLWLSKQSSKLRNQLANMGLINADNEKSQPLTLRDFLADYIARYGPAKKPSTVTTWKQCERLLLEFFPASKLLESFNPGDAEDFRNHLLTRSGSKCVIRKARPLAEATTRRRCGCAKAFFAYALAKGLIPRNPFDTKKVPTTAPRSKQKQFISTTDSDQILANLPNAEWRLLFSLARWGGMRVPSEPKALRWADIDFERMRINFRSPKTEHHDGKDCREIPIFPEIEIPLFQLRDQAQPEEEYVLPFLQNLSGAALRKPLLAAIGSAQIEPWDKLWTALRASRVTELREEFPSHVVDGWIGHDDKVARKHYTQTLDAHFDRALQKCSHFAASTNPQDKARSTENAKIPAKPSTESHGDVRKWAIQDSNL